MVLLPKKHDRSIGPQLALSPSIHILSSINYDRPTPVDLKGCRVATQPPLGSGEWSGTDEASGGEVSAAAAAAAGTLFVALHIIRTMLLLGICPPLAPIAPNGLAEEFCFSG